MEFADVVPVSAFTDFQTSVVADVLVRHLPESPPLYLDGELTDEPEQVMIAELIREAALEGVRDELPHSIAVQVEEMLPHPDATTWSTSMPCSTSSVTRRRASSSARRAPGCARSATTSRQHIEALLGTKVYLDLHVKVAKDWQRDPKQLRRLGF